MISLTDTLTDEPHNKNHDMGFYDYVDREFLGKKHRIQVEVLVDWDGTPKPVVRYYAAVQMSQKIADGISLNADTFIMLTEEEQDDFQYDQSVIDYYKEGIAADDHEKDANLHWDKNR